MAANDTAKVAIVKLPFQHRLGKMVLANLAGFLVSELVGNAYERYALSKLNGTVKTIETPDSK